MSESLEKKVSGPTPTSSFVASSLVGAAWEYLVPGMGTAYRLVRSLLFGAITPLVSKIFYPKVPLKELYRSGPADALGSFVGQYALSFFRGY